MDIHVPAVDNQILQRDGLVPHLLHVVLPEIGDIYHHVGPEDLDGWEGTCSWMGSSDNL